MAAFAADVLAAAAAFAAVVVLLGVVVIDVVAVDDEVLLERRSLSFLFPIIWMAGFLRSKKLSISLNYY